MKKIKQKDIEKHKQKKEQLLQAEAKNELIVEEIDYMKYIALQIVLGTIALIGMMVVMYMLQGDTTSVFLLLIAYFPYLYIKREAPKSLHILGWSIYGAIIVFGLFFR